MADSGTFTPFSFNDFITQNFYYIELTQEGRNCVVGKIVDKTEDSLIIQPQFLTTLVFSSMSFDGGHQMEFVEKQSGFRRVTLKIKSHSEVKLGEIGQKIFASFDKSTNDIVFAKKYDDFLISIKGVCSLVQNRLNIDDSNFAEELIYLKNRSKLLKFIVPECYRALGFTVHAGKVNSLESFQYDGKTVSLPEKFRPLDSSLDEILSWEPISSTSADRVKDMRRLVLGNEYLAILEQNNIIGILETNFPDSLGPTYSIVFPAGSWLSCYYNSRLIKRLFDDYVAYFEDQTLIPTPTYSEEFAAYEMELKNVIIINKLASLKGLVDKQELYGDKFENTFFLENEPHYKKFLQLRGVLKSTELPSVNHLIKVCH